MAKIIRVNEGKRRLRLRPVIIVGGICVVLIAGLCGWLYLVNHKKTVSPVPLTNQETARAAAKQVEDTWKVANTGSNYEKDKQTLVEKQNTAKTNKEKALVYAQLSQLATNNNRPQDALDYALEADTLNPTHISAGIVADKAAANGDKAKALSYYKIAIERAGDATGDESKQLFISEAKQSIQELDR